MLNKKKISTLILSAVCILGVSSIDVSAQTTINRLAGADRYKTAVEISKGGWIQADYAIIACGENFPDALSAAPLAKENEAPILLTAKDALNEDTSSELDRLKVKHVFLVGGSGVVSTEVENQIISKGIDVQRLWGANRYETAIKIAEQLDTSNGIIVANGSYFEEALSVSPIAASKGMPIILVPKDSLPSVVTEYLAGKSIEKTYVLGGSDLISDAVASQFPNTVRITGNDKYERNVNIINIFKEDFNFSTICVATGENFPDALAGSALAPKTDAPIVLVNSALSSATKGLLSETISSNAKIDVFGGTGAVATTTMDAVLDAVNGSDGISTTDDIFAIKSIDNINVNINKDDTYSLPAKVEAVMGDGYTAKVSVSWNPNTVDTSKAGTYTFEGNVKTYGKKVILTLVVK